MAITGETRIIDLPEKSSLVEGDFFVVDNENGATSKIPAAAVSGSATAGLVAKEYSNASTYAVGEYCIHVESGLPKLYKCTTAITTAEAWNSAHWTQTDAGSELTTANEDIASLNSNLLKCKTLNVSVGCTYSDGGTIGYRSLSSERVKVSDISGYPTGATILAVIPYATGWNVSCIAAFDGTYVACSAKNSGTYSINVTVIYI